MTAGRKFLNPSSRDAIIKDSNNWVWNGSRFCSTIAKHCEDAIRFKSLKQARQVAAHLRKIIPGSHPRATRATYPEQAKFNDKFTAIEVPKNEKGK